MAINLTIKKTLGPIDSVYLIKYTELINQFNSNQISQITVIITSLLAIFPIRRLHKEDFIPVLVITLYI